MYTFFSLLMTLLQWVTARIKVVVPVVLGQMYKQQCDLDVDLLKLGRKHLVKVSLLFSD